MKAIIVDDELHNIENLSIIIKKVCPDVIIAGTANNIADASNLIAEKNPDIVFLDIQMGKKTGFDLLKALPNRSFEVVFVTAYDKYGIQAVKYAALDYILKPVDSEELLSAINKAKEKITARQKNSQLDFLMDYIKQNDKPSKIALPQQNEIRYVTIKDIVRCEANNAYTYFYFTNGDKILISKPLKEYDELLAPHGFVRAHQSHLVNPVFVKSLLKEDGGILLMSDGTKIPVSKARKEFVKQALGKG